MEDRFKFRAWDTKKHEYIYGVEHGFQINESGEIETMTISKVANDDRYILEQCTGSVDKNGRLIFEGDIVETHDCTTEYSQILFDKGCYVLRSKDAAMYEHLSNYEKQCKKTGNIHENSELLEFKEDQVMQDRFKFRAWDSQDREYDYNAQNITLYDHNEDSITLFRHIERDKPGVTLEQCTGLYDEYARLIYEGDIVQSSDTGKCYKVIYVFDLGTARFLGENGYDEISCFDRMYVVGNIHENPELLEGK